MKKLYVFAYFDRKQEEMQTEYISANTFDFALEQFKKITHSKNIFPNIKRMTVYEKKEVLNI